MGILKVIELMSSSNESWEDATQKGIKKASKTLKNVKSGWVQSHSVTVKDGEVDEYRVNLKVSFEID